MMRRIRTVAVFPTMFTLGNLVCGFFSIVVAARVDAPTAESIARQPVSSDVSFAHPTRVLGELDPNDPTQNLMLSGWLIFLALIFDALDGHVARISRATSDFGAQLDSLCDVVTFGVAPGFLLVKMCPQPTFQYRDAIWIIGASFAACAALRLARFNVETGEEDDHLYFSGLPSPAAAAAIAGFGILFYELRRESHALHDTVMIDHVIQWVLPFFAMLVAALMVSRIPYPHIVNQTFRGQRSFGHVVGLVFLLVAIMSVRGYSVPIMGCGFVLYGPISYAWNRLHARREHPDPIF
ncbi:MAG TPA: CDP-diacylglycerol--serine O-phosphatidyltransferase [Pirellulales bacterium]|nr:CDP-diacylglycerol--serine O-phosphatidyltransferase [Pirellulales bacterium]